MGRYRTASEYRSVLDLAPAPLSLIGPSSWRVLVELAARRWGVTSEAIFSVAHDGLVSAARQHAVWLLYSHTSASMATIGRRLGRDHSTVFVGIDHHLERMAGTRRCPVVWTVDALRRFERLLLTGSTWHAAAAAMRAGRIDLIRCPGAERLRGIAREQARIRRWQARQALRCAA